MAHEGNENKNALWGGGWLVLIFLCALTVFSLWGWSYQLWDRYEVLPGQVFRTLMEEGGWMIPVSDAGPVPPLYYWITGGLVNAAGSSHAFVLRLPAMASAAGLVALVTGWTARWTDRGTGTLSGCITGTGAFFAWQATRMSPALTGALFMTGALFVFWDEIAGEDASMTGISFAFVLLGLGFLTVGPAAVIPLLCLAGYLMFSDKRVDQNGGYGAWMIGGLIFLSVSAIWLAPVAFLDGKDMLYRILVNPVGAFSPGEVPGAEPAWFYAEALVIHFLPWTLFLLVAMPQVLRSIRSMEVLRLFFIYAVAYGIIVSLWPVKDGVVLLPLYPVLGIVTGVALKQRFFLPSRGRLPLFVVGGLYGILFLAGSVVAVIIGPDLLLKESYVRPLPVHELIASYSVGGVLLMCGSLMLWSVWKRSPAWLLGSTIAGMVVLLVTVKGTVAPNLDARENLNAAAPPESGIQNLFLTWEKRDMVHTMTVNYQTQRGQKKTEVRYDTTSRNGKPSAYRFQKTGGARTVSRLERTVHHATLTGLKPDTTYYFVAGSEETGFSDEETFRTLPEDGELRYLVGGDQGTSDGFRAVNRAAAKTNPHFALIGGDMAYADGLWRNTATWNAWYRIWSRTMRGADGQLIPAVLALGNHEINEDSKRGEDRYQRAPFYFHYFEQGEKQGYFSKVVSDRLLILTLDTGYITPVVDQSDWIRQELQEENDTRYQIALYHRAMYPAYKTPGGREKRMRTHWEPLFNRYGVEVGFEHDGHVLKRTHRLRNGKRATDGIPYLGEGNWGMPPRTPDVSRPYLKKAAAKRHVWAVRQTSNRMEVRAIGSNGSVLDRLTVSPRNESPGQREKNQ